MYKYTIIAIISILITLSSCNRNATKKTVTTNTKKKSRSESFETFYNNFHKDSTFQMSRINFPIEGYNLESGSGKIKWTNKNWIMHRSKFSEVDTKIFTVDRKVSEEIVEEDLSIVGSEFKTKRIFKKVKGKWYLVYFINEDI